MTHDIAKIDNYSVYRRLGNKLRLALKIERRVLLKKMAIKVSYTVICFLREYMLTYHKV